MQKFLLLVVLLLLGACDKRIDAFSPASADQSISVASLYPSAAEPSKVGTYSGLAKSGGGYFYDEVLEYRVWLHPEHGAKDLAGDQDYFAAFAQYEPALKFSQSKPGAEPPIALVRQVESINEPSPGVYEWDKVERITEWQVDWLLDHHREPDSIQRFLLERGAFSK